MATQANTVDQDLYSRQIAVYGAETMGKLVTMRVLLHGLRGVGIETAKNLILAGPAAVTLHDDSITEVADLGVNFYLTPNDVGKTTRSEGSVTQLKELNPNVKVEVLHGAITEQIIQQFTVFVVTDFFERASLIAWNDFCRKNGIAFIYAGSLGLYGFTFVDFGDKHTIIDKDGEENRSAIIAFISQEEKGVVTTIEGKRHGFDEGDSVVFREVQGMTELNGQVYKISVKTPYSFSIDADTRQFGAYTREGTVEQVKVPIVIQSRSLSDSLKTPVPPGFTEGLYITDFGKLGRAEQLHIAFNALLEFVETHNGQLPQLLSEENQTELYELAKRHNSGGMEIEGVIKVEEVDEKVVKTIARFARTNISPVASFWGGVVAQEIVKVTGKFTPLRQWLHHEQFEALPDDDSTVNRTRLTSRYDDMITLFGRDVVQRLADSKSFLIGAGALGCEFLKMFALSGIATGENGLVTVTDDDNIEISNLNRQFLFRRENVKHPKSVTAGNAVQKMNPQFKVKAIKNRVAPDTIEVFNDEFWNSLDFAVNAVDNVKARLFVDAQCVWYTKPLYESGTLGTKCSSQVITPHVTQSYGDSQDPAEEGIPLCTLKNFPYQIEHTIQWARDKFEGLFAEGSVQLVNFLNFKDRYIQKSQEEFNEKRKTGMLQELRARLVALKQFLTLLSQRSFETCVQIACELFQDIHHNQIAQLLYTYPLDAKTTEGLPFWSGPKRPPQVLNFNGQDPRQVEFIQATANILAFIIGLPYELDTGRVRALAEGARFEPFVPKQVTIKADEKDTTVEKSEDDEIAVQSLINELSTVAATPATAQNVRPVEFEKDDPKNWHIEFVSSVANLRARNYLIPEVDNFKVKVIAGKIIPALATTTALIVGAVGIEIIKGVQKKALEQTRNANINLALPFWLFSEPTPATKAKDKPYNPIDMSATKAIPPGYTTWDKILVPGPLTVKQFVDYFKEKFNVQVSTITYETAFLYCDWQAQYKDRINSDIRALIENHAKQQLPAWKRYIPLMVVASVIHDSEEEVSADFPLIKYDLKANLK